MSTGASTVIGLGHLVDLIIRDSQEQRLRITPQSEQWLAWKPDTRDLVVLRPRKGRGQIPPRNAAQRHQRFHGMTPHQALPMEWPKPRSAMRTLGLIESVTYNANGIHSPSKGSHHWIHQFGDRGERGHSAMREKVTSPYAERFMPRLDVDAAGNLFVIRLPENQFAVRDWIIG